MNNIVDNLQTTEDLTYDHVYNKLMDLKIPTAVNSADNKSYKTADVKGKGKELRREPSRKGRMALPKECSYCKKDYPTARSDGHTWNECVKLKAANLKNKEKRTPKPVSTLSSVQTTTKISFYPRWVIDTGASSHMTNNLDLFINFETVKGTARLGDDSVIETCGRGTVVILAKTSIGHVSSVYLERVLWVPSLGPGAQLFLWGRDFLWLVPERICIFLGKIKQRLSGERLTDKIMLCKKRKSRQRR